MEWMQAVAQLALAIVLYIGLPRSTVGHMIEIKAEPKAPIEIELVGTVYKIQPPKAALALKLAVRAKSAGETPDLMMDAIDEWVLKAFGKTNAAKIQRRLDDPNDALDLTHIMQLMEAVVETSTGTPTS